MDSIKRDIVLHMKNAMAALQEAGLAGHVDADVEYQEGESLTCYLRIKHPSIQGHRLFEVRVKEVM